MQHSLEAMVIGSKRRRGGGGQRPVAARRKVITSLRILTQLIRDQNDFVVGILSE
jgi:hypothetical protein